MARLSEQLAPDQHAYQVEHGIPPDAVLSALAEETERIAGDRTEMRIAPEQGALLTLLARLVEARLIVEVGTFTGYSSICLARGLEHGGRIVTYEIDQALADTASCRWTRAGVADLCECRVGDARVTLRNLPLDPIDLAFVDDDKDGYIDCWEALVPPCVPAACSWSTTGSSTARPLAPTPPEPARRSAASTPTLPATHGWNG